VFRTVLVANRGAVARRVIHALRVLGVRSVAVFSEADAGAPYLAEADEALLIGGPKPADSYLHVPRILKAAADTRADAVHPGYGFLAENADFARAVEAAGMRFIGPSAHWIDAMGHKTRARALMAQHGLASGLGSEVLHDDAAFLAAAERLGYPVLVKPAAGGGGIGMLAAHTPEQLLQALAQGRSLASRAFASDELYLERLVTQPRHIEFQVLADASGARHLFERDCSIQRRHQKVVEECPAPGLPRAGLEALAATVAGAMGSLGYDNIGTVEMLRAPDGNFGFLEVNTRLQVEHGVTEMATDVDIVATQIRLAAGEPLAGLLPASPALRGHAIEARVYAEDPKRFLPSPGVLAVYRPPSAPGVRVDTGYAEGQRVTPFYDPLLAKVLVRADDRAGAIATLDAALGAFAIEGVKHNIPALRALLADARFRAGDVHTGLLADVVAGMAAA
jgi:acetyl-CoA carboxylase biotin carboxylase subunit